jgi:hypothetical protein
MFGLVPALLVLLLVLLLAWLALRPPSARVSGGAPAPGFAAGRALAHVQALAQTPRPVGSDANARARDYLVAQIRALGLEPEIQVETVQATTTAFMVNVQVTLAEVRNVVVRKPGTVAGKGGTQRPAVLVSARYDSEKHSLGAADGAASAAAMLETLRVLQSGPPLDNDVLFVFTDAGGAQALGPRGFAQSHPWAPRVRVALRFDRAGNRGPVALIGADNADGFAADGWAALGPAAHGSSFLAALYDGLPQRAASTPLAQHGAAVLHFAALEGPLGWSGVHDIPQRLSRASLQQEGDTMLALLRHFSNARLPAAAGRGQVFFRLPLAGAVHYPYALAGPLALLACALAILSCRTAIVRLQIAGSDIAHAAFGFVFMGAFATFATWLCREALAGLQPRWDIGVLVADEGVRWQVLAFLLLPAAIFVPLQRQLQSRLGTMCAALGAQLAAATALAATAWFAPGASYVLAWPLLAAQAAWLALASRRAQSWPRPWRLGVLLAAAVPAMVLMLPAAHDSAAWLSPRWLLLPSALVCLLLGLCGMLLERSMLVRPLLLAGAACVGLAYAANPSAPELPAPNRLVYVKDMPSWQAYWLHPAGPLDAWTRRLFPNAMHPYVMPYVFGADSDPVWYAAARRDDSVAFPWLIIEKDERNGRRRHVEFLLRSKNRAPEVKLRIVGTGPMRTSVNGRVLTDRKVRSWKLNLHGMGDRELRFVIDLAGDPSFRIFVQEIIPGLPDTGLPPRPAAMRPALLPLTGTTISTDILSFP